LAKISWTKKKIEIIIRIGAVLMTLNQGNTLTRPETVKNALIDQISIENR
jgi:hypothetical protein